MDWEKSSFFQGGMDLTLLTLGCFDTDKVHATPKVSLQRSNQLYGPDTLYRANDGVAGGRAA